MRVNKEGVEGEWMKVGDIVYCLVFNLVHVRVIKCF